MKTDSVRLTISRVQSSTESPFVGIDIEDGVSGILLLRIGLSIEEFGNLMTGLGDVKGRVDYAVDGKTYANKVGMRRVWESIHIAKEKFEGIYTSEKQREIVLKDFEEKGFAKDGWELADDGTRRRHDMGDYLYHIEKYVPVDEEKFDDTK